MRPRQELYELSTCVDVIGRVHTDGVLCLVDTNFYHASRPKIALQFNFGEEDTRKFKWLKAGWIIHVRSRFEWFPANRLGGYLLWPRILSIVLPEGTKQ